MNKRSFFLALFFVSLLASQGYALSSAVDTAKQHLFSIKEFTERHHKTIKNSVKAIAALYLLKGLYNVMRNHVTMYPLEEGEHPSTLSLIVSSLIQPYAYQKTSEDEVDYPIAISSPPYLTALGIASYLVGYKKIYTKIGTWMKERLAITNPHALQIIKHTAKIGGAVVLLKGHYNIMRDQLTIIRADNDEPIASLAHFFKTLWSPTALTDREAEYETTEMALSRPPYLPALGISSYLLSSGIYGIYKEVQSMKQQSKNKGVL